MDCDIIQSLKDHYKKLLVSKFIELAENNEHPLIDLKKSVIFVSNAWNMVNEKIIQNCFKKANVKK